MPRRKTSARGIVLLGFAFAAALVACAGPSPSTPGTNNAVARPAVAPGQTPHAWGRVSAGIGGAKIQHVVFVIQENRSFDNIFGGLDDDGNPFPGADSVSKEFPGEPTPVNHLGYPVQMYSGALKDCYSAAHDRPQAVAEIDGGKMDGFDLEDVGELKCATASPQPDYVYQTVRYADVAPYWEMGERFAISDRMFESILSSSFGAHLYLAAAQSGHIFDYPSQSPWGCDSPSTSTTAIIDEATGAVGRGPYPCLYFTSLPDQLDAQHVTWNYYAAQVGDYGYLWSVLDAFARIREGPEWSSNVIGPPAQFLTDVANGKLAAMTWVTPTNKTSDHPESSSNLGPAWVASVVDAVGESKFWNSTAILIVWDDWGGWYDHVPPPVINQEGFGLRVPFIVVSPYARQAYVSHTVHSFGSMIHFAEEMLGVASLGQEDAFDDDLGDMFDFSQTPAPFNPFASRSTRARAKAAAAEAHGPPPDTD
jgi:phospholipase C